MLCMFLMAVLLASFVLIGIIKPELTEKLVPVNG